MTSDPYLQAEIDALTLWSIKADADQEAFDQAVQAARTLAKTAHDIGELWVSDVLTNRIEKSIKFRDTAMKNANRSIEHDEDEIGHREHQISRAGLNF